MLHTDNLSPLASHQILHEHIAGLHDNFPAGQLIYIMPILSKVVSYPYILVYEASEASIEVGLSTTLYTSLYRTTVI